MCIRFVCEWAFARGMSVLSHLWSFPEYRSAKNCFSLPGWYMSLNRGNKYMCRNESIAINGRSLILLPRWWSGWANRLPSAVRKLMFSESRFECRVQFQRLLLDRSHDLKPWTASLGFNSMLLTWFEFAYWVSHTIRHSIRNIHAGIILHLKRDYPLECLTLIFALFSQTQVNAHKHKLTYSNAN